MINQDKLYKQSLIIYTKRGGKIDFKYWLYIEIAAGVLVILSITVYKIIQLKKRKKEQGFMQNVGISEVKITEEPSADELGKLLQAGLAFIDKKDIDSAKSVYEHITETYSKVPDETKRIHHQRIIDFYNKINEQEKPEDTPEPLLPF